MVEVYRKKSDHTICEAIQFNGHNQYDVKQFAGNVFTYDIEDSAWQVGKGAPHVINVKLMGKEVKVGDYIVKDSEDRVVCLSSDMFNITYDVEEDELENLEVEGFNIERFSYIEAFKALENGEEL